VSGFVGLLHLDSSPADVELLRRMTAALAFRGPDAQEVWVGGAVGFGHTLLRTTDEAAHEHQPFSFEGQVWITADARVDAREDLLRKLKERGRRAEASAPDVELILHAYLAWGEDCVRHLLGDFSFAIWDGPNRRLFCARDHFGVKPFFYAKIGHALVIGNTLDCLRLHPAITGRLNELAVADFLLFLVNQDPATTIYSDIQRLAAAHVLVCSDHQVCVRPYWSLPTDGCTRYRQSREYVEHFRSAVQTAVRERLRTNRFVVSMSGGLDSPAVAAVAKQALAKQSRDFDLRAQTFIYEKLIHDEERHYAGLVARHLGIPIQFVRVEEHEFFEVAPAGTCTFPEPQLDPYDVHTFLAFRDVASSARVMLTGHGGDPMMFPSTHYLLHLVKQFRVGTLLSSVGRFFWSYRRKPPLGGMRRRLRTWLRPAPPPYGEFPPWLNPAFATRLSLAQRWDQVNAEPPPQHPTCPEAYRSFCGSFWPFVFETVDPGATRVPVETRHPLFDVRLIELVLSFPPIPWFWDKYLLREALCGILPEDVRRRPKAPLRIDPVARYFQARASHWVDDFTAVPQLSDYVVRERIPRVAGSPRPTDWWFHLRPLALNLWLQHRLGPSYKSG
jgi:asparagine synthase (glutamine-hydrolysing)